MTTADGPQPPASGPGGKPPGPFFVERLAEVVVRCAVRDPYADLAALYDVMAGDPAIRAFYDEWRRSLRAAFADHGVRPRVLVDLACGTGNSTVPWAGRRGLRVVGVDRSEAMLRVARKKSVAVRWYRQDLRALRIVERADVVTCHFDALNHVLREAEIQRVFHNVARILVEGGLFQFDLNTRHMLRWLGGRQKLLRAGPHWYMADNAFDPSTGIATFRQVWFVASGRLYRKMEVVVRERAYDDRDLRRMLRRAGMDLVEVRVQRTVAGRPGRKVYLARVGRGQTSQIRNASSRARRGSPVGVNSWARKPVNPASTMARQIAG
jgi:ubiquinone/menaquinone biosynthesis C-methylase UbiE